MKTNKKVLIIGYGGTIIMTVDPVKRAVVVIESIEKIKELLPDVRDIGDIDLEILSNKDSTNVGPSDWSRLAMHIYNKYDEYDAFVVTHGTNTMAYTASALTLALGPNLNKPIVITGAQLPFMLYGTDARFNFENSLKVAVEAAEKGIAEVMVVFSDNILRGCRSVKVSESKFRAFDSPAFPHLGIITSTGIDFLPLINKKSEHRKKIELRPHFGENVLCVDLTPGQSPDLIEEILISGKCKGLILKSHGAGSIPDEGSFSFVPLIEKATQHYKIPVIVSTKFLGGNAYKDINDECALNAVKAGAIPGGDLTDVMTEVKLMWILSQGTFSKEEVKNKILKDYTGEITEFAFNK